MGFSCFKDTNMENKKLLIEEEIEDQLIKQDFRPHLGASEIGHECYRKPWYSFRWFKNREITPKQDRLFNRGHMEELIVIEDLINAGCKVEGINIDESIHKRFYTLFNIKLPNNKQNSKSFAHGHGGSSLDAIIHNLPDAPKIPHLFECKTSNTKNFIKTKILGVEKTNHTHYVQMNVYMKLFKLKWALYVIVCKETDERHYERVKYNKKVARLYVERTNRTIASENPPPRLSDDQNYYKCGPKWCEYRDVCFGGKLPIVNCRTCRYSGLRDKGGWVCEIKKKEKEISYKKQAKGCKKYKVLEKIS